MTDDEETSQKTIDDIFLYPGGLRELNKNSDKKYEIIKPVEKSLETESSRINWKSANKNLKTKIFARSGVGCIHYNYSMDDWGTYVSGIIIKELDNKPLEIRGLSKS